VDRTLFVLTGPSGAGKSTVARLLAERFPRGVHLEGDVFRRSIVSGRREMTPEAPDEAVEQLKLRYRLAATAADAYFDAGFAVVLDDVIAGPMLPECLELIRSRPLHVVALLPRREIVSAREAARSTGGYEHWSLDALYDLFARDTPRLGLWLDTSDQTPEETVGAILAGTGST
jgi:chloramphenicol 3-O-phosphotransferase